MIWHKYYLVKTRRANAHTTHFELYCMHSFSADLVTFSKGQRSPRWCTLVALMWDYNHTKFEESRYHSLWNSPIHTDDCCMFCESDWCPLDMITRDYLQRWIGLFITAVFKIWICIVIFKETGTCNISDILLASMEECKIKLNAKYIRLSKGILYPPVIDSGISYSHPKMSQWVYVMISVRSSVQPYL